MDVKLQKQTQQELRILNKKIDGLSNVGNNLIRSIEDQIDQLKATTKQTLNTLAKVAVDFSLSQRSSVGTNNQIILREIIREKVIHVQVQGKGPSNPTIKPAPKEYKKMEPKVDTKLSITKPDASWNIFSLFPNHQISATYDNKLNQIVKDNEQFTKLRHLALNESERLPHSKNSVTQSQIQLAEYGRSADEIMSMSPAANNLSVSQNVDLGQATTINHDLLKAFSANALDAAKFNDMLIVAKKEMGTTLNETANELISIAKPANDAGVAAEEAAASMMLLHAQNIKGERASSAFTNVMSSLKQPTDQINELFNNSGVTLKDSNNNLNDLTTVLPVLREHMKGLTLNEKAAFVKENINSEDPWGTVRFIEQSNNLTSQSSKISEAQKNSSTHAEATAISKDTVGLNSIANTQNVMMDSLRSTFPDLYSAIAGVSAGFASLSGVTQFLIAAITVALFNLDKIKKVKSFVSKKDTKPSELAQSCCCKKDSDSGSASTTPKRTETYGNKKKNRFTSFFDFKKKQPLKETGSSFPPRSSKEARQSRAEHNKQLKQQAPSPLSEATSDSSKGPVGKPKGKAGVITGLVTGGVAGYSLSNFFTGSSGESSPVSEVVNAASTAAQVADAVQTVQSVTTQTTQTAATQAAQTASTASAQAKAAAETASTAKKASWGKRLLDGARTVSKATRVLRLNPVGFLGGMALDAGLWAADKWLFGEDKEKKEPEPPKPQPKPPETIQKTVEAASSTTTTSFRPNTVAPTSVVPSAVPAAPTPAPIGAGSGTMDINTNSNVVMNLNVTGLVDQKMIEEIKRIAREQYDASFRSFERHILDKMPKPKPPAPPIQGKGGAMSY
ncbi:phage tail tape measure protein [Paenibacillus agilis]|uniref:Phage tail tape measure protein n=1 Tax=Paenibacillus agilis TaxID=3020863 RepID=A0A559IVX5_9BACL|nr:phage tail tape measure protein [Paenibacillus agilis]TVX91764.1 phage tail tape measure protein [Paenibacillus agilis]